MLTTHINNHACIENQLAVLNYGVQKKYKIHFLQYLFPLKTIEYSNCVNPLQCMLHKSTAMHVA